MKKLFISLLVLTFSISMIAQQVTRERVIVEIGTGGWCPNCPAAARGADDLVANGHDVAIIEYHYGDPYQNAASDGRHAYYGINGWPDAWFDGVINKGGGSYGGNNYNYYLPAYNTRIAIPCDYTASLYGENTGLDYMVTAVIDLEDGTLPPNVKARLALTESEIPYTWQGMTEFNFVCREMYPDHSGTDVDFGGGDQMIINYSFSIDASWVTQHIELVFFLQDDDSHEILQGTWTPIEDLIPFSASAHFSCSNQEPCETTSVDFIDESLGQIISWNWTFEGGTPATSTEQNPVVTYNTPGSYDVQLMVDDGTTTSTLNIPDYISVLDSSPQASTPTGPSDLCSGKTGYTYTTDEIPGATVYTWTVDPTSAGNLIPNGNTALFDVDASYSGTADIKVKIDNACGSGTWSDAFQATVYVSPSIFWISDGSSYCIGTQGVEVTLDGSETGIDYELQRDGVPTGTTIAGTGSALSFGYQTIEGIYTIFAYSANCDQIMYGTAYIYPVDIPGQAETPYGEAAVCIGGTSDYTTTGAIDAETYVWVLDPVEAGTITGTTLIASVEWSASYSGSASITVQGINDCGDGVVSDPFDVNVEALPSPEISGEEYVYQYTTHAYSSPDHAGATYDWSVTGGTIDSGQGTNEISVSWGGPGTGHVNLTETSAIECEGIATELVVEIQPMGINESFIEEISLYPNPAGETLNIEMYSQKNASITVQVLNQVGQIVINSKETLATGNNKTSLNTSDLNNGYYTLKLMAEDGTVVQEKFIIMK